MFQTPPISGSFHLLAGLVGYRNAAHAWRALVFLLQHRKVSASRIPIARFQSFAAGYFATRASRATLWGTTRNLGRDVVRIGQPPSPLPTPPARARGFTLLELMVSVAIIAILATVAVPQFTHHMRMARTAEATLMLDVMKKGATMYYAAPRTLQDGTRLPCQFPSAVGITPAGASCCDPALDTDADGRCDENPQAFNSPTWEALGFGLASQHFFQYTFQGTGALNTANATMSAYGDQDCDGVMATFHLVLDGDPAATMSGCDSTTSAGFFHDFETE